MTTAIDVPGTGYGNPYLDSLILGVRWELGTALTYYFGPKGGNPTWTASEKQAFGEALDLYESFTGLQFVETNIKSQAIFVWEKWSNNQIGSDVLGEHYYPYSKPGNLQIAGHFNYQDSSWQQRQQGGYGFVTIIHEIGHGLGLEHPHDGEETFPGVSGPWDTGTYNLNQGIWTTMTYNDGWDQRPFPSEVYGSQGMPMAFDIAALQALYGANMSYHTGDDVYQLDATNGSGTFWACIWDAGVTADTISNDGSSLACIIDLRSASLLANDPHAGGYVSADAGIFGGYTIAHNALIENAIGGGGNDNITGNDAANNLAGGAGNDIIDGKGDADTMTGGAGNDTYYVDDLNDVIVEEDGGGTDTVFAYVAFALPAWVESLFLIDPSWIIGTSANDTLTGDGTANTIDGLTGADKMSGLGGDDTYFVDSTGDKVIEAVNAGADTVHATSNYTIGTNIENLVLEGSSPINGTGNTLANTITGNDAANSLNGMAGADTMIGGDGNDTYFVDNVGDVVTETVNQGTDTIKSSITHTLDADVENLVLTGSKAINGTGNDLANTLTGNSGANILDGGLAADSMSGLKGNDTYIVDDAGDTITEESGGGTDTVMSAVTFTLGANLENLVLTGSDPVNGTGNALANTLTGNDFANVLQGLAGNDKLFGGIGSDTLNGGLGADTLTGGAGADTFQINTIEKKGDTIADFVSGVDKIEIAAAGFANASVGNVHLVANATPIAADSNATFLFDTENGKLSWDDDGNGAHHAQLFTTLTGVHALAANDLMIV